MRKYSQKGVINTAALVAVVMTLLFIGTLVFAISAFGTGQDYKNNANKKIDAAVATATKATEAQKDAAFAEQEKSPVKTYAGPSTFGTVTFDYPKTYSGYVASTNSSGTPLDASFYPGVVPAADDSVSFALRVQVVGSSYDNVLRDYDSQVKSGKATATAFRAAKVPGVLGVRIDGAITSSKTGSLILLPLRDKTLKIWTESTDFKPDFNKYVVPSLTFIP